MRDANPGTRYFPTVHKKKRAKFINSVKEILDRRAKGGISTVKRKLELKIRGWSNYFFGAVPVSWMKETDAWIRRRVRQLLWKQWKKPGKMLGEFRKRVKRVPLISEYAYSSNRYWTMSKTPVINRVLSNKRLLEEGGDALEQFAWKG